EIEARTGVSIPTIFEIEGEAGFRRREAATIEALAQESGLVLATGGGAVLDPASRAHLKSGGWVVYLDVPPDVLWARTRGDRNRPLLQVADPRARVRELHGLRDPLYREVADYIAESGQGSPLSIVRKLEREYLNRCAA
ncbi:MAG: shikimate kinase, partial [Methyloversatilis sp.]|nr:shikimate kinase [Methyloversatilis sp.]